MVDGACKISSINQSITLCLSLSLSFFFCLPSLCSCFTVLLSPLGSKVSLWVWVGSMNVYLAEIDHRQYSLCRERYCNLARYNNYKTKQSNTKWRWAGHVARMQDDRWTIRTTEWQVRKGRRPRGRPKMRWKDDIMKWQGATWTRTAKDRKKWKELTEGYFQQWRDTA